MMVKHRPKTNRSESNRGRVALAALSVLIAITANVAGSASASTSYPTHWYFAPYCSNQGYYGDYVLTQPQVINTQPGVNTSIIDGTGYYVAPKNQYVYVWLWIYSTKYGWVHSAPKRFLDGYPSGWPEEWNSQQQAWVATGSGLDIVVNLNGQYSNLSIGADELGIRVPAGTYRTAIETYWAPPFTTPPSPTNPTIPGGGLDAIDYGPTCSF